MTVGEGEVLCNALWLGYFHTTCSHTWLGYDTAGSSFITYLLPNTSRFVSHVAYSWNLWYPSHMPRRLVAKINTNVKCITASWFPACIWKKMPHFASHWLVCKKNQDGHRLIYEFEYTEGMCSILRWAFIHKYWTICGRWIICSFSNWIQTCRVDLHWSVPSRSHPANSASCQGILTSSLTPLSFVLVHLFRKHLIELRDQTFLEFLYERMPQKSN